jgi:hypothetical protein
MGLETAALVMAGVAAAAEVGKMGAESAAAKANDRALDLQAKQMELQNAQKTLSNYDVLQKVLDAQEAHMTVTGTAFSSPSFNAIQRATLNIASKKQKNLDIENEFNEENIRIEKQNVRNTLYSQLFGDTATIAMTGASLYHGAPAAASASGSAGAIPTLEI